MFRWVLPLFAVALVLVPTTIVISQLSMHSTIHSEFVDHAKYCETDKSADAVGKEKHECKSLLYRNITEPAALTAWSLNILTALLVLFTSGLVFAGRLQVDAARQALGITRETSERQLRAYVGIESISLNDWDWGAAVRCAIVVKNYGQTPAFNVRLNLTIVGAAADETDPRIIAPDSPVSTVLMPGAMTTETIPGHRDSERALSDILRQERLLWVGGHIAYVDIFNRSRRTDVRMFAPYRAIHFVGAPTGNGAT